MYNLIKHSGVGVGSGSLFSYQVLLDSLPGAGGGIINILSHLVGVNLCVCPSLPVMWAIIIIAWVGIRLKVFVRDSIRECRASFGSFQIPFAN